MAEPVTVTARVTGTCPNGHTVAHDLQVTVPKGSGGIATARADCGACGKPVNLSGPVST